MNESSPAKSACRQTYQGDDALKTLLSKAGSTRSPAEIRELVAGVLAAPPALDARAWHILVAPKISDALAAQLDALAAEIAAARPQAAVQPKPPRARIDALRAEIARRKLDGFVLPRGDEHQGEYVSPRAERLAWLTGFTGSAGATIVLADKAAMFVDGRYTLQVKTQVDGTLFEYRHLVDEPPHEWLQRNAGKGGRIGYDPWLHSGDSAERLRQACAKAGAELVALGENPVDAVWKDQPPPPVSPAIPHPVDFAGRSMHEKRADLVKKLKEEGLDAAVISAPDSLAWLLNIRGGDVPHTPLALGFAVVRADADSALELYMDERKLPAQTRQHLGNSVDVRDPAALGAGLDALGKAGARVLTDRLTAAAWIDQRLAGAGAVLVRDVCPCALPKACKNERELAGARAAHLRDGASLVRFLAWFAREAPTGKWDEIAVSDRLFEFRRAGGPLRDTSFDTISGAGPNGAIVHYRSTPETSRRIEPDMLYLLDSGAQYPDGTTDVTRTMAVGRPTDEQKDRFTRVLKGHIAIARARFPKGTSGSQLDVLARHALWQAGLDYDHGTGHGVGAYLSVHEGPHRISKMPNSVALQPGMIVSNEPGYYKTGAYGIRIENLVAVREADPIAGAERPMLAFETLTLAPIDRALVARDLLDAGERDWLDAYHARVLAEIGPLVDEQTRGWLEAATARI